MLKGIQLLKNELFRRHKYLNLKCPNRVIIRLNLLNHLFSFSSIMQPLQVLLNDGHAPE